MILLHPVLEVQFSERPFLFSQHFHNIFPKLCDEDEDDEDDGGGARFQLVIYASCRFVPLFNKKK